MNEIERPALVRNGYRRFWFAAAECDSSFDSFSYLQMRLSIDSKKPRHADNDAIAPEHDGEPSRTKSSSLNGERVKLLAQLDVVTKNPNVTDHPPIRRDVPARSTFAYLECVLHCQCRLTPLCRRQ